MTKNELAQIIDEKYIEAIKPLKEDSVIYQYLTSEKPEELLAEAILLSSKICKNLIYSVLEQVLPELSPEDVSQ